MQRFKLTVEYIGTAFYGWQRQPNVPSIQQAIEEAIFKFSRQKVQITVAGRTDAGVHAMGQVFHVDLDAFTKPMNDFEIMKAINAHLRPEKISIINVEPTHKDFHARFAATNKLYKYRIINRPSFVTKDHGLVWHIQKHLDVDAMQEAAQHLLGNHDFSTFRAAECQANSPLKTLDRLDVIATEYDPYGGREIVLETEGKSFLHHQVRNMVGSLSLVGLGKWSPKDLKDALDAKDRAKGGPTAPADGLYLMRVDYPK